MEVAEQQLYKSETFNLYCRMAGDLYKMQCESERSSGSTTMFSWLYNSATDAYLDGGYIEEAAAVAFQHSYWLMTNALSRDEEGKQTYLDLSVSAFYEIMKRSKGKLAGFIYEQREGRRRAADALQSVQPPAHLTEVEDPAELAAAVQVYRELIAYLEQICEACDIAAYLATELAAALKRALPELAGEYATLAEGLQQRHAAILQEHGIPVQGAGR
jgi:hypothetical protein